MSEPSVIKACRRVGRALVIAPHPDDEAVGAAVLMRRLHEAGIPVTLVFATTGVPESSQVDNSLVEAAGGIEAYRATRAAEGASAVALYGVEETVRLAWSSRSIIGAMDDVDYALDDVVTARGASVLLGPAFEGGHPDHDALHCICAGVASRRGLPFWQYAGYHWKDGTLRCQEFYPPAQSDCWFDLSPREVALKQCAIAQYKSQWGSILQHMRADIEGFRRAANHAHEQPSEQAFYEIWGAGVSSAEVRAACLRYDSGRRHGEYP